MKSNRTDKQVMAAPLKQAKGLGSAKYGVGHWWAQRWTGLFLAFLGLWLLYALTEGFFTVDGLANNDASFNPMQGVFLLMFILLGGYHAFLGLKVIIEDYVHAPWARYGLLLLLKFLLLVMGTSALMV